MERRYAKDSEGNYIIDSKTGQKAFVWDYKEPNERAYIFRILHWISQGFNVFSGGHQDLTLSATSGAMLEHGHPKGKLLVKIINTLWFWEKNHCQKAWENKS